MANRTRKKVRAIAKQSREELGSADTGNRAALRAGRRLADPHEVVRLVLRAGLDFLNSPMAASDSARMRAALVPFLASGGVVLTRMKVPERDHG